jgi:SAM-dependent methyltransferase
MAQRSWYKEFFGQHYLDAYQPVLTHERTVREVDFIEKTLALPKGAKILDLCCGHGRHLIELACRGYEMTGLDLTSVFLDVAREEADRRGLNVRLELRDMRDIRFVNEFDAVINVFTAFGYLESDEEDQKVLEAVARALKSGGLFLMELMHRDSLARIFQPRGWYETDAGLKVLEERSFDPLTGRNNVRHITIYPDGTTREMCHSVRIYTLTELNRMLTRAGLSMESTYGGVDGSPFTLESRRLIMLSRRP